LWLLAVTTREPINRFSLSLVAGVVFKFADNGRNCERTFRWRNAHISVCIFYINTRWVRINGKQRSEEVRLVIISVAVFDKKLSSIRNMSASCHSRGVPRFPLLHISNIPLLLPTDNSCVVCVGVVVSENAQVCDR
jgi:hypothetical protein